MPVLTIRGKTKNLQDHEVYEGLRMLWQALRAGDLKARLDTDVVTVPNQITVPVLLKHIERHEETLSKRGIELAPPVYAPGSAVLSVGDHAFKVQRRKWEDSPEISGQLQALWRLIRREERRHVDVPLCAIHMGGDGAIDWGEGLFYPEMPALKQLLKLTGRFGAATSYVADTEPDLRARNWNGNVHGKVSVHREVRLRLRRNPLTGRFSVFAAVTPKYGVLDIDHLATALAESMPTTGMRGTVFYDSELTNLRIEGHWEQEYVVDRPSQDIFRCGVQIRSNDTGNGGIWVLPIAMRVLTSAQILLRRASAPSEALYHAIHQGDMGRVAQGITNGLSGASDAFADFEGLWGSLRAHGRPYGLGPSATDEQAFEYIYQVFLRNLPTGLSKDEILSMLILSHRIESVGTAADLVNAVGRLHDSPRIHQYQRESLEEATMKVVEFFAGKEVS